MASLSHDELIVGHDKRHNVIPTSHTGTPNGCITQSTASIIPYTTVSSSSIISSSGCSNREITNATIIAYFPAPSHIFSIMVVVILLQVYLYSKTYLRKYSTYTAVSLSITTVD